ncbi:MAG: FAD-dependent oxidoreductase, partial [Priestia megaterium]
MKPLVVIGGGPAGYVAAITAARQGKQVTLIEQKDLGGTCLNEGCMPTKSLLASAEAYEKIKKAEQFGINLPLEQVKINWDGVQHHKTTIVKNLVRGIGYLMKKNSIKVIKGEASFLTNHCLAVRNENHVEEIEAE